MADLIASGLKHWPVLLGLFALAAGIVGLQFVPKQAEDPDDPNPW